MQKETVTERKIFNVWNKFYSTSSLKIEKFIKYVKKLLYSYNLSVQTVILNENNEKEYMFTFLPKQDYHRPIVFLITDQQNGVRKMHQIRLFDFKTTVDIINQNVIKINKIISDLDPNVFKNLLEEHIFIMAINLSHIPNITETRFKILVKAYAYLFSNGSDNNRNIEYCLENIGGDFDNNNICSNDIISGSDGIF